MAPMAMILPITGCSDGDASKRPVSNSLQVPNDNHYLDNIALRWAKDQRLLQANATYRLDRLPTGYACFEKTREKDSNHIDRYLWGHPKGVFRSMNEFYPHFLWLMEHDSPEGCTCRLCSGTARVKKVGGRKSVGGSISGSETPHASPYVGHTGVLAPRPYVPPGPVKRPVNDLMQGRLPDDPPEKRHRSTRDEEGTPDVYRTLIGKLQKAGIDGKVDEPIAEYHSPDWRTGHSMLVGLLNEWKNLPAYVPRVGELVLFVRGVDEIWDPKSATARWEAGVVTQMPAENLTEADLQDVPHTKQFNVVNSGFRIEPISEPNNEQKAFTKRHSYVPLHAIRPLSLWKDYTSQTPETNWHPTIHHALVIASSFSLVAKYHFKGTWPDATIFTHGIYLGAELLLTGDTAVLTPRDSSKPATDIIVISAIHLCVINLTDSLKHPHDETAPYQTCLHVRGRAYTLDPSRSFNGITKTPIQPHETDLSPGVLALGPWYHVLNPAEPKSRLEIPYTRLLARCPELSALKAWSPTATAAVDTRKTFATLLAGTMEARAHSTAQDTRITSTAAFNGGKTWFWGDTRVQQLDLYEVNGRFVWVRDKERDVKQLGDWRQAVRVLDGRRKDVERFIGANKDRGAAGGGQLGGGSGGGMARRGMVLGSALDGTAGEGERMEVDGGGNASSSSSSGGEDFVSARGGDDVVAERSAVNPLQKRIEVIDIDEDSD